MVGGDGLPENRLAAHLARELNRPFARPRCRPFRFSVVDAGPKSHYVSLTYDHWVADSVGARLLMRHVLGRYLKLDIPENRGNFGPLSGHVSRGLRRIGCMVLTWRCRCCGRFGVGSTTDRLGGWPTLRSARWPSDAPDVRRAAGNRAASPPLRPRQ